MLTLTVEHVLTTGRPAVDELARCLRAAEHVDVIRVNTVGAGYVFAERLEQMLASKESRCVVQRFNPAAPPRMDVGSLQHITSDPRCAHHPAGSTIGTMYCPVCTPSATPTGPRMDMGRLMHTPSDPACVEHKDGYAVSAVSRCQVCSPERPGPAQPTPGNLPSITCPRCGRTSYHPQDIVEGYCGNCHDWTSKPHDPRPA